MPTTLQQLLGPTTKADFIRDHLHRQPFSRAGVGEELTACGSWEVFAELVCAEGADVLAVRQGKRHDEAAPSDRAQMEQLCGEGYTLLVRHAQRHHAKLQAIADDFTRDFHAPVNIHMYATPAGEWGFPWHYDAEEVFILQTTGRKEYSLRKNTVNPWPIEETLPADMQYEREIMPLLRVDLAAGDWLYIPGGWWHKAASKSEEIALSLAIGVMPRTALEVLDFLREKLCDSMLWRQRLPISGEAACTADMNARYRDLFAMLADALQRELHRDKFAVQCRDHFRPRIEKPTQPTRDP